MIVWGGQEGFCSPSRVLFDKIEKDLEEAYEKILGSQIEVYLVNGRASDRREWL